MPKDHRPEIEIESNEFRTGYHGKPVLDLQRMRVRGNCVAIIGHNGAGKSTLIKAMLHLLPALSGELKINYRADSADSRLLVPDRDMVFSPESGSVFADISVRSYLRFWCRLKHRDAGYLEREGARYIELLELEPLFSKLGRELSKGQRRRVQTAIGFLLAPSLFLFDEPFDGLDVQKTTELVAIIEQHRDRMAFIVSSHRMDVVERLADSAIVLEEGGVKESGPIRDVCRRLCGVALAVRNASDPLRVHEVLAREFPLASVFVQDAEVRLLGRDVDITRVRSLLPSIDSNGAFAQELTPSLSDAVNHHLLELTPQRRRQKRIELD